MSDDAMASPPPPQRPSRHRRAPFTVRSSTDAHRLTTAAGPPVGDQGRRGTHQRGRHPPQSLGRARHPGAARHQTVRPPGPCTADWAHIANRTDITHGPSTQLYVAARILAEWGWQQRPHHLRDFIGRRCLCGAICAAVGLGVGMPETAHRAAGYVLAELRRRGEVHEHGWPRLIGDWNAAAHRTGGHRRHPRRGRHSGCRRTCQEEEALRARLLNSV